MMRRPPRSTRTDTLLPSTTLCRSERHPVLRRCLDAFLLELRQAVRDCMGPVRQPTVVGDLDVQARARVQLENERALFLIEHHVDTEARKSTRLTSSH